MAQPTFMNRVEGLLSGENTLGNLGIGLLAASRPTTQPTSFGQVLGQGVQYASARQQQAGMNQFMREHMLQKKQQSEAQRQASIGLQDFIVSQVAQPGQTGGLDPNMAKGLGFLAKFDPRAAATQLGGLLGPKLQEFKTDTGKLFADLDLAESQGNTAAVEAIQSKIKTGLGPTVDFDDIRSTRNDVIKNSQDYLGSQQGYGRVQVGAQSATPAGDLALIFGYMKTLDPTSTVREGEAASVQAAGSVPERIRGVYNRIVSGERLTTEQRTDFLSQAEQQFGKNVERQQTLIDDFTGLAKRNQFPVSDVIPQYLIPDFTPGATPQRTERSLANPLTQQENTELQALRQRIFGAN
ncbi:MAG: hypothetical protein WD795_00670 [Woeseia sp.]